MEKSFDERMYSEVNKFIVKYLTDDEQQHLL